MNGGLHPRNPLRRRNMAFSKQCGPNDTSNCDWLNMVLSARPRSRLSLSDRCVFFGLGRTVRILLCPEAMPRADAEWRWLLRFGGRSSVSEAGWGQCRLVPAHRRRGGFNGPVTQGWGRASRPPNQPCHGRPPMSCVAGPSQVVGDRAKPGHDTIPTTTAGWPTPKTYSRSAQPPNSACFRKSRRPGFRPPNQPCHRRLCPSHPINRAIAGYVQATQSTAQSQGLAPLPNHPCHGRACPRYPTTRVMAGRGPTGCTHLVCPASCAPRAGTIRWLG